MNARLLGLLSLCAVIACGGASDDEASDLAIALRDSEASLAGVYVDTSPLAATGAIFELRLHDDDRQFFLAAIGRRHCDRPGYSCGREERRGWGGPVDVTRVSGRWSLAGNRVKLSPEGSAARKGPELTLDIAAHDASLIASEVAGPWRAGLQALALADAAHSLNLTDLTGTWRVTNEVTSFVSIDGGEREEASRSLVGYGLYPAPSTNQHVVTFSDGGAKVRESTGDVTLTGSVRVVGGPRAQLDARGRAAGLLYVTSANEGWSLLRIEQSAAGTLRLAIVDAHSRDGHWWALERTR